MWRSIPKVGTRNRVMQIVNESGGLIAECDYIEKAEMIAAAPEMFELLREIEDSDTDIKLPGTLRARIAHVVNRVR